jgi:tetratricopeptide (TPR) repeat protein
MKSRLTLAIALSLSLQLVGLSTVGSVVPALAQTPQEEPAASTAAITLPELLAKSLTAYGGEANVAQLASGFNVYGREFDNLYGEGSDLGADLEANKLEARPSSASFRLTRKGVRWRLDHERGITSDGSSSGSAAATASSIASLKDGAFQNTTLTEGFNGEIPWVRSGARNGARTEDLVMDSAKLLNLETNLPASFVMEGLRLAQEPEQKNVVFKGEGVYRGTPVWQVEFRSPNGSDSFMLSIEKNNYMVVAISFNVGEAGQLKPVVLDYREYQPSAGSIYPHKIVRFVDGKVELVRLTSDISLNGKVKDSEFDRPGGTFHLNRTVVVPFDYGQREILVKGRLNNGEELDFLFDTGASDTIIDRRVAAENNLLKEGVADMRALAGSVMTNTSSIGRLELGNLVINDIDARILDLSSQSRHLGRRLGGIIGTNVISKFVVAIDYGKTSLSFFDADSFAPPKDCVAISFARRSAPVVKVKLNGREDVMMLVDTGAAFNNLPATVATRYAAADATARRFTEGTGIDGRPVKLGRVVVDNVSLGGKILRKVDFTYTLAAANGTASGATKPDSKDTGFFQTTNLGILGNPFLENFFLYFDYKYQRMLLKPSGVVKSRSAIDQAIDTADDQLIQKRDFRIAELNYNKALLIATGNGDKKNEAKLLGRFGNLRRMMAKDLGRPEHSKASYEYFVKAQELAKKSGATEIEGRILADWSLLYLDGNQPNEAKQTIDRALVLAPQDANVNIDFAVHLFRNRRFPEMQRYVEKALFLDAANWQGLWYQVKLSELFGDTPKVISTLKEILRNYPWSLTAQEKLKQMLPATAATGNAASTGNAGASTPPSGAAAATTSSGASSGSSAAPWGGSSAGAGNSSGTPRTNFPGLGR